MKAMQSSLALMSWSCLELLCQLDTHHKKQTAGKSPKLPSDTTNILTMSANTQAARPADVCKRSIVAVAV